MRGQFAVLAIQVSGRIRDTLEIRYLFLFPHFLNLTRNERYWDVALDTLQKCDAPPTQSGGIAVTPVISSRGS